MTEHLLKTLPDYWNAISNGEKTFEVRRDDRGFQKGDVLILRRMKWQTSYATGSRQLIEDRSGDNRTYDLRRKVKYILTGGQLGIEPGYVVMGLGK